MFFWRSVVGKLWMTILLLVACTLIMLTVLLTQFFEKYQVEKAEDELMTFTKKVEKTIETNQDHALGRSIVWMLLDDNTNALIIDHEQWKSPNTQKDSEISLEFIKNDSDLNNVLTKNKIVIKKISLLENKDNMLIVGIPLKQEFGKAVFVYQSLQMLEETDKQTTRLILLAAFMASILTTIFAFFLSTRITAPLRKMKEVVKEMEQGNFDTKLQIVSKDEIGQLAKSFNQMGQQLRHQLDEINQEKEQLASILRSMADGVVTLDSDGHILLTNPPAENFLDVYEKQNEKLPEAIYKQFLSVISEEKEQMAEILFQGRSLVILMTPLYNEKKIRGVVAVMRDMTKERQMRILRREFIANVSHELRTPISMIQGYSEALLDDMVVVIEERKELVKVIYDESLRMGRLVNDLLDLAQIEEGHITLNCEETNVYTYVERIVRKFHGLAKERNIRLEIEQEQQSLTAFFDNDRMEQVFVNLIDNAIRHTGEFGVVTIKASKMNGVYFTISDSGCGIPEEELPFVFERFYKVDKARTRGKSGVGIGLAIVKNIVKAHGGTISVQSKVNEGTVFTIKLEGN